MNRFTRIVAATALMSTAVAFAQTATQSVEVRAPSPVRTDVRALCPDVDQALHEALVNTVQEVAADALIDVRFELRGRDIDAVQTGAGPSRYQRMLKRAVRALQCDSRDAAPQQVALRVRFVDPFTGPVASAMAAVSLASAGAPAR
jgi:uncharacterized iron-regulated protein